MATHSVEHDKALFQLQNQDGFSTWYLVDADALKDEAESRLDDSRSILKYRAVTHQEIWFSFEKVNLVRPPSESNKVFSFILFNLQNLGAIINIKLIEFKNDIFGRLKALII